MSSTSIDVGQAPDNLLTSLLRHKDFFFFFFKNSPHIIAILLFNRKHYGFQKACAA